MSFLLAIYFLLFSYLVYRRLLWGLILIAAFLPSYLIRFTIFGLPFTLLEGMILITIIFWIIQHGRDWPNVSRQFFKLKPLPQPWNQWLCATVLFLIAATISVWISPQPRAALGLWKAYFVEPVLLFAVLISTVKDRQSLRLVVWGLVLGALPVALFACVQKFTGWLIPNPFWQAEATRRVTSFFGYPNAVALYLAPLLPFVFYLLINEIKNQKSKIRNLKISLLSLLSLLSFLSIVFAQSTGALVAIAAIFFFAGFWIKKTRWWAVGLLCVVFLLIAFTPLKDPFAKETLLRNQSGAVRINMWAETVEMLKARPLLGAGLAGYQETVRPFHILKWAEIYLYPHNLFLNFWTETGLLGLIAFGWLIALFFKKWVEHNSAPLAPYLFASMLIILIHGLVDVPYFKNDLAVIFWIFMGLMISCCNLYKNYDCGKEKKHACLAGDPRGSLRIFWLSRLGQKF